MRTIFLDGQFFQVSPKIMDAFTPGIFKAKGVFETMLGVDSMVMDVDLHMRRLKAGLKILGIRAPSIKATVLGQVLSLNRLTIARVRLMVWKAGQETHLMALAVPYQISSEKKYRACLIQTQRPANSRLSQVKSLDYELFANAYDQAKAKGYEEALLLNRKGHIFEASHANVFWIKNQVLYTPPLSSGCLNGVTRQQVMKQAKRFKTPVRERILTPEILKDADLAFLTNSLIGIKLIEKE